MAKIGATRIVMVGGGRYFLIPASVAKDKAFPFKAGDEPIIEIEKDCIKIRK